MSETTPWDEIGVSRATYYRRAKAGETARAKRKPVKHKTVSRPETKPVSQKAAHAAQSYDMASLLKAVSHMVEEAVSRATSSHYETVPVQSHDDEWASNVNALFKNGGAIWKMNHKAEIAAREKADQDAALKFLAEEIARDEAETAQREAEEAARDAAETARVKAGGMARAAAEQDSLAKARAEHEARARTFIGALEAAGLTDPDIDGKALQAAFFGDAEGDALDRYEFAILNALCDDPRAIEGIFEDPLETIQHVRRLAQTSTFDDAERYRKWLKGLAAAYRRRPAVPVAAPEPVKELDRATETAHYVSHTIVQENVQPKALDLVALLAQLDHTVSAPVSMPAPVPVSAPVYIPQQPVYAPVPEPDEKVVEEDDAPLDDVSFEEAQAFIMSALAAEGYLASDLDLEAVERAANDDEAAMTDPLGSYHRAVIELQPGGDE